MTTNNSEFEAMWRMSYPALRQVALCATIDLEDAEDLLGETSLRAIQALHLYNPAASFRDWVCEIMANVWLETLAGRIREPETTSLSDFPVNKSHEH